ncbi:MAG: hypothetical protein ACLU3F_17165 [Blautia wexlerae]
MVKAILEGMNQEYGVQNFDNGVEFWFTLDQQAVIRYPGIVNVVRRVLL